MPILSVEGMLDAMPGAGHNSAAFGTQLQGTPYLILGNGAGTFGEVTVSKDADGWLTTRTGPATSSTTQQAKYCGISRHLADLVTFTSSSYVYGGVRIKALINATQLPLVTIHDRRNANMPNQNTNQLVMFNYLDIPGGVESGREYYFEWAIDMPNKKILRRLDGVRLTDILLSSVAAMEATILAQACGVCYGFSAGYLVASSTVVGYSVKDIYIGEKVDGETTDWLGPRNVVPIAIESVDSVWTASSGTVLSALNTPITDSASFAAPSVTSDAAGTEASINWTPPNVAGKVNAVVITSIAKRQAATMGALGIVLKNGANEVGKSAKSLSTTSSYYQLGVYNNAPGDVPWTKELIDSVTLKVKPTN